MATELAYRKNGGLAVALFWDPDTNGLLVSVSDSVTGDLFTLDANADSALDVFHHPYAYASQRGIDFARREEAPAVARGLL
jgi:hypothetical protein